MRERPRYESIEGILVQARDEKEATIKAIRAVRATYSGSFSITHPVQSYETAEEATRDARGQTAHEDYVAREGVAVDTSDRPDDGGRR